MSATSPSIKLRLVPEIAPTPEDTLADIRKAISLLRADRALLISLLGLTEHEFAMMRTHLELHGVESTVDEDGEAAIDGLDELRDELDDLLD